MCIFWNTKNRSNKRIGKIKMIKYYNESVLALKQVLTVEQCARQYNPVLIIMFIGFILIDILLVLLLFKYGLYKDYIKEYRLQKHFYEWKKYNKNL